ncbi:hypothetical protein EST38_g10478 [Candolleomyces aberdarensis]|uniref:FAS1 domain-containing protein n=1 Tax=Candolleomyces aberdarensis TaxID=2316362 RepID=A0A4Q2D9Q4_9AGAR|nr:hypothetical protein EST38_g10478 [Candolleomyces aberdarensis]
MVRVPYFLFFVGLSTTPPPSLAATFQEIIDGRGELSAFVSVAERFTLCLVTSPPKETPFSGFLQPSEFATLRVSWAGDCSDLVAYHILPSPSLAPISLCKAASLRCEHLLAQFAVCEPWRCPNVMFASAYGSTGRQGCLEIYSGFGPASNVAVADLPFDNGYVHIITRQTTSKTVVAAQLLTLMQAVIKTNLTDLVDATGNLTVFAPTDDAFREAGIEVNSFPTDTLGCHALAGTVGYSTVLGGGQGYRT